MIPRPFPIDPRLLAFDIDGVVADTMALFVRLAHEKYGLTGISKEDISCYNLSECLRMERHILEDLVGLILDDEHTMQILPFPGAREVLTELAKAAPLRFVTARLQSESISRWLFTILSGVPEERIKVIASGSPENKVEILNGLEVRYFVEDRIETCRHLKQVGIEPLVFDQPWNRSAPADGFIRICNWIQLREWVLPSNAELE
jgi:hypothetical protein